MTRSTTRRALMVPALMMALMASFTGPTLPAAAAEPVPFQSDGNPILSDGSYYTADAAPLVTDGKLYIYTGHDEAAAQQGGFVMNDYAVLETPDPASGDWVLHPENLLPGEVFAWATGNAAYAGHTVEGDDGRYYWYAPVQTIDASQANRMAIGVAVSDTPVGPWSDLIGEPLLDWADVFGESTNGQEVIDPHVFRDDDGAWYLYWGSWYVARVVELAPTMDELVGEISTLEGLDGFFEAPWVFKRGDLYYLAYDWKSAGSDCTPSNYQACIAYATADNPLGPWDYQGIILGGTSATTVHPSIVEFDGAWYVTYHTRDADGGGHFRRSVAIDELSWDGATILPVTQTWADDPAFELTENVALEARATASFTETPPMRVGALNDGRQLTALLPPDQWGNYRGTDNTRESDWVTYTWDTPVRIDGAGIQFHRDSNWIRPPANWGLEYLDAAGNWHPVEGAVYPTAVDTWNEVRFAPVTTSALRATFNGQPEGPHFHSVAVSELEVHAVAAEAVESVEVITRPGAAPELPEAVRLDFGDAGTVWAPVNWSAVDSADYATEGTFTVAGRALGHATALVSATVLVDEEAEPTPPGDGDAPAVAIALLGDEGAGGWFSSEVTATVMADDATDYRNTIEVQVGEGEWAETTDARNVEVALEASGAIRARATDSSGNTSGVVTREVRIDTVAPEGGAVVDPDSRATTVTATDALSGLASLRYSFDGGAWNEIASGDEVPAPDALPHELAWRATDVAGNVSAGSVSVPIADTSELSGNIAPYADATATYTAPWNSVEGVNDGTAGPLEVAPGKLGVSWGTWPEVGEQVVTLTWGFEVTVDSSAIWWFQDSDDAAGAGMIAPSRWVLEYLGADEQWHPVVLADDSTYDRARNQWNPVTFEPVTTTSLRAVMQSWGEAEGGGSAGINEWQVFAADDGTDPTEEPSEGPSEEPSEAPSQEPTQQPTQKPTGSGAVDVYSVPGFHNFNGRWWFTDCEAYSQTARCETQIWATSVVQSAGRFVQSSGWTFNNLTYLPWMTRAQWGSNPLANAGEFTSSGRQWRTECDTAVTGRGGCRTWVLSDFIAGDKGADGTWTYAWTRDWVFNNMVRFGS